MIDDRSLCICGHEEFDHDLDGECHGDFRRCKCKLWTPLEPFLQGD